jgi:hypothetical protein
LRHPASDTFIRDSCAEETDIGRVDSCSVPRALFYTVSDMLSRIAAALSTSLLGLVSHFVTVVSSIFADI